MSICIVESIIKRDNFWLGAFSCHASKKKDLKHASSQEDEREKLRFPCTCTKGNIDKIGGGPRIIG